MARDETIAGVNAFSRAEVELSIWMPDRILVHPCLHSSLKKEMDLTSLISSADMCFSGEKCRHRIRNQNYMGVFVPPTVQAGWCF